MTDANDLRRQRHENTRAARKILDDAEDAGRDLTAEESAEFDRLIAEADQLEVRVRHHEYGTDPNRTLDSCEFEWEGPSRTPSGGQGLTLRTADGRTIRAAEPGESFASVAPVGQSDVTGVGSDVSDLSLGRTLIASLTGDWSGAEREWQARDQLIASDPAGGYLIQPAMSNLLIDQAREQTVLVRAGARTVPLSTTETRIVTVDSDPTAGWRGELEQLPATDVGFGQLLLSPRTLGAIVTLSQELVEDAANAPEAIENALRDAVSVQLDRALFRGVPENAWLANGVLEHENVNRIAAGRVQLSYDHVLQGIRDVSVANGAANASIVHPRDQFNLDTSTDANNQYLQPPAPYQQQLTRKLVSNQVPTDQDDSGTANNDESSAVVGNFASAYVLLGMRNQFRIEASREAGDAFERLGLKVRIWGRFDIAVGRPKHLTVVDELVA